MTAHSLSPSPEQTAVEPPALRGWERVADRVFASDPGLVRLQTATRAVVSMGSALGVEWVFRRTAGGGGGMNTLLALLIGAVLAMMGSMGLASGSPAHRLRTGLTFPVAMGIGLTLGTLVSGHRDLMLVGFVAVMFAAVAVRRFGMPFFFHGFMGWMGYFFASFLSVSFDRLPALLVDAAVAAAWVVLLATTVLRGNPRRDLRRTVRAFGARSRAVAGAAADLLSAGPDGRADRGERRLRRRQDRLAEATLFVEGHLADPAAVPPGWTAGELRRRLLDLELAVDELSRAAITLAAGGNGELRTAAAAVLQAVAARDLPGTARRAEALRARADRADGGTERHAARRLGIAADDYVAAARAWRALDQAGDQRSGDDVDPPDEDFEPAVDLMMGNLPGSASTTAEVSPRGGSWNPLTRLSQTTRQALQVALSGGLAIVAGEALSHRRYYWAVIAAFVTFTGTATRSETVIKAANRVLGTLAGLGVSLVLAHLTSGDSAAVLAVILASVFCGFYLQRLSYAYMIFFITILIGQLYALLGTLTAGLLVLRLEETAVGAACGIVVGLLFLPVSTRDAARAARAAWYGALADLLDAAAGAAEDRADPDGLARTMGSRLHQLVQISGPLSGMLGIGTDSARVRHRLALHATADSSARSLVPLLRERGRTETGVGPRVAVACLAAAARALGGTPPEPAEARSALDTARAALDSRADAGEDRGSRSLDLLAGTLGALLDSDRGAAPERGR